MKQERLMSTNPIKLPDAWSNSFGQQSFLTAFLSMATSSISQLGQAKLILRNLVSPTYLFLALIRVSAVLCFMWLLKTFYAEGLTEPDDDEDSTYGEAARGSSWTFSVNPLTVRLVFIFVYTEFLVRSMTISTYNSGSSPGTDWTAISSWIRTMLYGALYEVRVWRVVQLSVVVMTYIYKLFSETDEY
ncbi:uncharacterized protein LOC5511598 [Nematostella vectensis]|uniref:uncharacterized protein LOC5511598 n=1 Tax=Nematostella vectensis TaxID=45351 RepID=UPI0020770DD9|nr:uncharacterized protein LOC5511598 [Nematostella vectensis]